MIVEIPERLRRRPVDKRRGVIVPYFVAWLDSAGERQDEGHGEPDFRVVDPEKFLTCVRKRRCWLCGEPLGVRFAFVIGPMCAVTRTTSEPPSHRDCAVYAMKVCPFLTKPRAQRNERGLPDQRLPAAGNHLDRNPGGMALWQARSFRPFRSHSGQDGILFEVGEPEAVEWYREGRPATRAEVLALLADGFPTLLDVAKREGDDAVEAAKSYLARVQRYLPPELPPEIGP